MIGLMIAVLFVRLAIFAIVAYAVFVIGHSGWWFALAVALILVLGVEIERK